MKFNEAVKKMKQGYKVKRPNWSGYWNMEDGIVMMHYHFDGKKEYEELQHKPLQDTDNLELTIYQLQQKDWEVVDDKPEVDWEAEYIELYNELLDYRRVLNEIMEKVQARLENREEETICEHNYVSIGAYDVNWNTTVEYTCTKCGHTYSEKM